MRKLALAAGLAALVLAAPALADGRGGSSSQGRNGTAGWSFDRAVQGVWKKTFFGSPDFSRGRHFGWFRGKHWGWFKPHNPHWPHEPPVSP